MIYSSIVYYFFVCRNVLSSQEVVDFISERIKPDESGKARPLSSIVEEVRVKETHLWSCL